MTHKLWDIHKIKFKIRLSADCGHVWNSWSLKHDCQFSNHINWSDFANDIVCDRSWWARLSVLACYFLGITPFPGFCCEHVDYFICITSIVFNREFSSSQNFSTSNRNWSMKIWKLVRMIRMKNGSRLNFFNPISIQQQSAIISNCQKTWMKMTLMKWRKSNHCNDCIPETKFITERKVKYSYVI